jgi:hypothetical protein
MVCGNKLFFKWLEEEGLTGCNDFLEIAQDYKTGRGLEARKDVSMGLNFLQGKYFILKTK